MENKRGVLKAKLGEIGKKVVTALAITLFVIPSEAKSWYYIFGGRRNYGSHRSRPYYTPHAFGRRLPDGSIHSGYVPADTRYSMRAKSHKHSGLVSRRWYRLPSGLKDLIPPRDWGNYDVAKEYARRLFVPKPTLVKKIEKERPSYKERLTARRARTAQLKKEAEERKQQEGLNEPALFRSYFDYLGEPYRMPLFKSQNQTAALYVEFPSHPDLIIEWHDPKLMDALSKQVGTRGYVTNYENKLKQFQDQGKTLIRITEAEEMGIRSRLEDITARCSLGNPSSSYSR